MIYEFTLEGLYYDQQSINRWNYLSTGSPVGVTGAFALITALGFIPSAGVFPALTLGARIQSLLSPSFQFISAQCKAIREAPADFYDNPFPAGVVGTGGGTGDMSPTAAYGFRTNRTRTDISRGTKRFTGVQESVVGDGGIFSSGTLGAMDLIAAEMSEVLSYTDGGNSLTFAPIIVSKEKIVEAGKKDKYRYYETIAEQLEHIMQGITWQPYRQQRTQVSRQYGHGA